MILAVYLRGKQSVGIRAIHVLSFIIQCGDDKRITEMGVGALQIFAFTDIIIFFFKITILCVLQKLIVDRVKRILKYILLTIMQ